MIVAQIAAVESDEDEQVWLDKQAGNDEELAGAVATFEAAGGAGGQPRVGVLPRGLGRVGRGARHPARPGRLADDGSYATLLDTVSQPLIDVFVDHLDAVEADASTPTPTPSRPAPPTPRPPRSAPSSSPSPPR